MLTLQIYIDNEWKELYLPGDISISIEENSPVWDTDASTFSEQFELSVEMNRHVLGNIDHTRASDVYSVLYGKKFRLYVGGTLFRSGIVRLDDTVEIVTDAETGDATIEIELASAKAEFSEIFNGIKLTDLPIYEKNGSHNIRIGTSVLRNQKIWVRYKREVIVRTVNQGGKTEVPESSDPVKAEDAIRTAEMPKIMIPHFTNKDESIEYDYVNIGNPYSPSNPYLYPYCNVRLCYQRYDGTTKYRAYDTGEPGRVNSSPCFFVPFILYKIFETKYKTKLGATRIFVKENALESIPDFLRLALFHASCHFDEEAIDTGNKDKDSLPNWYGTDSKNGTNGVDVYTKVRLVSNDEIILSHEKVGTTAITKFATYKFLLGANQKGEMVYSGKVGEFLNNLAGKRVKIGAAYANADNLPDTDIMEFIEGIQNGFCCRFVYDSNSNSVRIILLRDVLLSETITEIPCDLSAEPYSEHSVTRGFRLKYGSATQVYENPITKEKVVIGSDNDKNGSSVDTSYNYNDYRKVEMMDADSVSGKASYKSVVEKVGSYNDTTYIDKVTGNVYRVKVDKDADDSTKLYPSLIEVGAFGDVEYGDCSVNDFVEEVSIGFAPVIPNDINAKAQMESTSASVQEPKFATLVDVEIAKNNNDGVNGAYSDHKNYDFSIVETQGCKSATDATKETKYIKINSCLDIYSQEHYKHEEYECPYDKVDTGFTLGILRDSTSASDVFRIYGNDYDGEGNSKWTKVTKSKGDFTSDSIDQYGDPICTHYIPNSYNSSKIVSTINAMAGTDYSYLNVVSGEYLKTAGASFVNNSKSDPAFQDVVNNSYYAMPCFVVHGTNKYGVAIFKPAIHKIVGSMYRVYAQEKLNAMQTVNDKDNDGVIIKAFLLRSDATKFCNDLMAEGVITGVESAGLSLKLREKKYNPYHGASEDNPIMGYKSDPNAAYTNKDDPGFFPVEATCARRGLFDQFYTEYAYWVVNRKIVHIKAWVELADLINIDFTKKYRIGEYVGFLKSVKYTVDNDGLSEVDFELYYL